MLKGTAGDHGYTASNFVKRVDDQHKLAPPVKLARRLHHAWLLVWVWLLNLVRKCRTKSVAADCSRTHVGWCCMPVVTRPRSQAGCMSKPSACLGSPVSVRWLCQVVVPSEPLRGRSNRARTEWCLCWWRRWEPVTGHSPRPRSGRRSTPCPACEPRRWTTPADARRGCGQRSPQVKHKAERARASEQWHLPRGWSRPCLPPSTHTPWRWSARAPPTWSLRCLRRTEPGSPACGCWWRRSRGGSPCAPPLSSSGAPLLDTVRIASAEKVAVAKPMFLHDWGFKKKQKKKRHNAAVECKWQAGWGYLSSHGVVVSGSGEGAAQLTDLSCGFVDGDDVPEREDGAHERRPVSHAGVTLVHEEGLVLHGLTLPEPSPYWGSQSSCCPNRRSSPSQSSSESTCPPWRPDRKKTTTIVSLYILTAERMFCCFPFNVATHVLKYCQYLPKHQLKLELMDVSVSVFI